MGPMNRLPRSIASSAQFWPGSRGGRSTRQLCTGQLAGGVDWVVPLFTANVPPLLTSVPAQFALSADAHPPMCSFRTLGKAW
jgi:hypothetical protein